MAKGSKTFSLSNTDKKKRSFEPFPAGDYDLKILANTVEIKTPAVTKERPNPIPYVNVAFEAIGTAQDGGKNRRVYHMFFCSLKPGKDGIVSPATVDQLKGFADALGDQPDMKIIEVGDTECVSQLAVKKFIEEHDGEVVRAHVAIQKGSKDYPDPKNVIKEFIETDESSGSDDEEDEPEEDEESDAEETDEDESDDEGDEDSDDEDEDEGDEEDDDDEDEEDDLAKATKKKAPAKSAKKKKAKK